MVMPRDSRGFHIYEGRKNATVTAKCAPVKEVERGRRRRSLWSSWKAAETNKQDNQLGKHRGHGCKANTPCLPLSTPPPHPAQIKRQMTTGARYWAFKTTQGEAEGWISAHYWLYVTVRTKNHNRSTGKKQNGSLFFFLLLLLSRASVLCANCVVFVRDGLLGSLQPRLTPDTWSLCLLAPLQSISNSWK